MAGEDVIELGSSDDEAGPVVKKIRKPKPNVMVHIPGSHSSQNRKQFPNNLGKIKIVNVQSMMKPIKKNLSSNIVYPRLVSSKLPVNQKTPTLILNPLVNTNFKTSRNNIKLPIQRSIQNVSRKRLIGSNMVNSKCLPSLPPEITVTRTARQPVSPKRPKLMPTKSVRKTKLETSKNINKNNFNVGAVLTVELDDDDDDEGGPPATLTPIPAWYMKPEETNPTHETDESVKEGVKSVLEVTIEDSPVKSEKFDINKKSNLGEELAITIEDSPVNTPNKQKCNDLSNKERNERTPNSKKRLEYPDDNIQKGSEEQCSVIVEINLNEHIESDGESSACKKEDGPIEGKASQNNVIDVIDLDTPSKMEVDHAPGPLQKVPSPNLNNNSTENSSINPVYLSFIDLCMELENTDDMRNIVEKKIVRYYKQVPREYTESEAFIDLITFKINFIRANPSELYFQIRDIVDELKFQKQQAKAQIEAAPTTAEDSLDEQFDSELESKRERQVRKLEKTLGKLHTAIQKLEEQEVNFDDDADSVYILVDRYKERLMRVHAKLCQLKNMKMPSEPRIHIDPSPGRPLAPVRRLEAWINKRVPVGAPLPFPDFHDVLNCVKFANRDENLGMSEIEMMAEARDLFIRCGKKLQRRRQENEWRSASSRLTGNVDPAESNPELKFLLESNRKIAAIKENEIINKYADKQSQLKLEPAEISDKDIQGSSESDYDVEEICEIADSKSKGDQPDEEETKSTDSNLTGQTNVTNDEVFNECNLLDSQSDGESAISVSDSSDSDIDSVEDSTSSHMDERDIENESEDEDYVVNGDNVTDVSELSIVVKNVFSINGSGFGAEFEKGTPKNKETNGSSAEIDCTKSGKEEVTLDNVDEHIKHAESEIECEGMDVTVINENIKDTPGAGIVNGFIKNIEEKNELGDVDLTITNINDIKSPKKQAENVHLKGNSDLNADLSSINSEKAIIGANETDAQTDCAVLLDDKVKTLTDVTESRERENESMVADVTLINMHLTTIRDTQPMEIDCIGSLEEKVTSVNINGPIKHVGSKSDFEDAINMNIKDGSETATVTDKVISKDNSDFNSVLSDINVKKVLSDNEEADAQSKEVEKSVETMIEKIEASANVEEENKFENKDLALTNTNVTDTSRAERLAIIMDSDGSLLNDLPKVNEIGTIDKLKDDTQIVILEDFKQNDKHSMEIDGRVSEENSETGQSEDKTNSLISKEDCVQKSNISQII